ncbi:MAG: alanine racemase, partial [Alphaproteobacteria bacterium]
MNLTHIAQNYQRLQRLSAGASCAAVVKADAYGLGAAKVATTLAAEGCDTFFVAMMEEGVSLRASLPDPAFKIYVLAGVFAGEEQTFLKHALSPVLNSPEQAQTWLSHIDAARTQGCHNALHLD